jgi:hypothetical protein
MEPIGSLLTSRCASGGLFIAKEHQELKTSTVWLSVPSHNQADTLKVSKSPTHCQKQLVQIYQVALLVQGIARFLDTER